jgi:NADPH2:quinone reductase
MRAWRAFAEGNPADVLRLVDVDAPPLDSGHVRIAVETCGLNFPDLLLVQGKYQHHPTLPFTPGSEICGHVIEVASTDSSLAVGERVIALTTLPNGGLAEEVVVSVDKVRRIPATVNAVEAACLQVTYPTAHLALHHRANLQRDETVLIHAGAGGVGSATIQLALAHGARVIATAGGAEKTQVCRQLGADVVIDYLAEDFVDVVKAETNGRGADVIIDPVGGDVFDRSGRCVAWEGRIVVIGFTSGVISKAPVNHILLKNYAVLGLHLGMYRTINPELLDRTYADLLRLAEEGVVRPFIGRLVELEEVRTAMMALGDRLTVGKVVVRISDSRS